MRSSVPVGVEKKKTQTIKKQELKSNSKNKNKTKKEYIDQSTSCDFYFWRFSVYRPPRPLQNLPSPNATVHECRVTKALAPKCCRPSITWETTWQLESAADVVNSFAEAGREQAGDQGAVPRSRCQAEMSEQNREENAPLKKRLRMHTHLYVCALTQTEEPLDPGGHGGDALPQALAGWQ